MFINLELRVSVPNLEACCLDSGFCGFTPPFEANVGIAP